MGSAALGSGIPFSMGSASSSFLPSMTGIGNFLSGSGGQILGGALDIFSSLREDSQQRRADAAENKQLDANQRLLNQQATQRAEDLTRERAVQESSARAVLAARYGPDFGRSGTSSKAFQDEGDRLFRQDKARNQSNLAAQTAGIQAQKSAVKAGTPGAMSSILGAAGAGAKAYGNYKKTKSKSTVPTLIKPAKSEYYFGDIGL